MIKMDKDDISTIVGGVVIIGLCILCAYIESLL